MFQQKLGEGASTSGQYGLGAAKLVTSLLRATNCPCSPGENTKTQHSQCPAIMEELPVAAAAASDLKGRIKQGTSPQSCQPPAQDVSRTQL